MTRLLIFGYGFTGAALVRRLDGWTVSATSRDARTRERMAAAGLDAIDPTDPAALGQAVAAADAILIAAPPGEPGCPGLAALAPLLRPAPPPSSSGLSRGSSVQPSARVRAEGVASAADLDPRDKPEDDGGSWAGTYKGAPSWIAYLSTTGVYGDRAGGWVREDTPATPASPEGDRRLQAEQGWRDLAKATGSPLFIFRLPGIYGPGRSPLDRVRAGTARRWVKPGQVFSRIHVDDLADALARALARPQRAGVYNLCDDEPAAPADVTAYAARLLGIEPPPEEPLDPTALSPMARRFWAESKRISNARAKAALGWRPAYPTYREGLEAVHGAEDAASSTKELRNRTV